VAFFFLIPFIAIALSNLLFVFPSVDRLYEVGVEVLDSSPSLPRYHPLCPYQGFSSISNSKQWRSLMSCPVPVLSADSGLLLFRRDFRSTIRGLPIGRALLWYKKRLSGPPPPHPTVHKWTHRASPSGSAVRLRALLTPCRDPPSWFF